MWPRFTPARWFSIRYLRQAFESSADEDAVRVTFDREICYKVTDEPQVRLGGSGWQHNGLTTGYTILEIKFTGDIRRGFPAWCGRSIWK